MDRRIEFVIDLARYIHEGRDIIYFDETTSNIWDKRTKVWQYPKDPSKYTIPAIRGSGVTIFGSISNLFSAPIITIGSSTNQFDVKTHFQTVFRRIVYKPNAVIVLDNHKSHSALIVNQLLQENKVKALYLPPNGSFLNPIERYWAYFKKGLSRIYMEMDGT